MSIHTTIISKEEESSIWPGNKNAFKCEVLYNDNTKQKVDIVKEEVNLIMYLNMIKHKLTETEVRKLKDLIEDYGQMKYSEGSSDEAMSNAGEDL